MYTLLKKTAMWLKLIM